jgi:uncharacterized protein VirK/YbjX
MKNSNNTIGNQTCKLPACSAVPQPIAPTHAPYLKKNWSEVALTAVVIQEYQQVYQKRTNLT